MVERRLHTRYRATAVSAIVHVPESPLDYYFRVDNLSREGLALIARVPESFPFGPESVVDLEIFTGRGTLRSRGVVARLLPGPEVGFSSGFAVRLYGMDAAADRLWCELLELVAESQG